MAFDRRAALRELEGSFLAGAIPGGPAGPHRGSLLRTTLGHGLDVVAEALARVWMPWRGKMFAPSRGEGRNVFASSARPLVRLLWPRYGGIRDAGTGSFSAFTFRTEIGDSVVLPGRRVLRIDYDLPENPSWPVRRVLDELVEVGEGRYLGQALLRLRGRWRRMAWFRLTR